MLKKFFAKKSQTSIGLDKVAETYFALRLEFQDSGPKVTHRAETNNLQQLISLLEPADQVITRPPLGTYFNRRVSQMPGNWTEQDYLTFGERGYAIFNECQRFTPFAVEQAVYGWKVLGYDSVHNSTEVEIHLAGGPECARVLEPIQALCLGPVKLEAYHCNALACVIPPKFTWYILETRYPDGLCLVRENRLTAHVTTDVLLNPSDHRLDAGTLRSFIENYQNSKQPGLLQAFFVNPKARHVGGLSCSWIGDNCAELVGTPVDSKYLQALGLAMSRQKEWWLHHVSEFYRA